MRNVPPNSGSASIRLLSEGRIFLKRAAVDVDNSAFDSRSLGIQYVHDSVKSVEMVVRSTPREDVSS